MRKVVNLLVVMALVAVVVFAISAPTQADIGGSDVIAVGPAYVGEGATLDFTFTVNVVSPDLEYLSRFTATMPAEWTINSVAAAPPSTGCNPGSQGINGQDAWWGEPPDGCGVWSNGTYDFTVNVTIGSCDVVSYWDIPWLIEGDIFGNPPHTVSDDTPTIICTRDLTAYAVCSGDDLEINILAGDLPIEIRVGGELVDEVDTLGQWYMPGPGVFNDVTLWEWASDVERLDLGSFNCPSYGVPNLGLVQINATAGLQPYGMPGMEMQNFVLPADFDGNGYDTYIVTDVELYNGDYWLGLFIGSGDWVYVPYSAVIPLTPIAGID